MFEPHSLANACNASLRRALVILGLLAGSAHAGSPPLWVTQAVSAPGVSWHVFHSQAVGAQVSYHVYRPAAYAAQPQRRFPVLYWLHGTSSTLSGIATLAGMFDAAIASGRIPPLLVVFPNGLDRGMWCDAESGLQPVESMVVQDLVPEVDAQFRTIPQARARLLEGFSMGGYGTGRLALQFADRFGAASMLAAGPLQLDFLADNPNYQPLELRLQVLAEVYGNSLAIFELRSPWRLAEQASLPPGYRLRQIIGSADSTLEPNRAFHQHLLELGIVHEYIEVPGVGHSVPALVAALGDAFWNFHAQALRDFDILSADGFEAVVPAAP